MTQDEQSLGYCTSRAYNTRPCTDRRRLHCTSLGQPVSHLEQLTVKKPVSNKSSEQQNHAKTANCFSNELLMASAKPVSMSMLPQQDSTVYSAEVQQSAVEL